jgi:site-specific recombinase XerD
VVKDSIGREYHVALGRKQPGRRSRMLAWFADFADVIDRRVAQFRYRDFELYIAYLQSRGMSQEVVSQDFFYLRRFFDHLVTLGVVTENIPRSVLTHTGRFEPRKYSDAELIQIHRQKHPRR